MNPAIKHAISPKAILIAFGCASLVYITMLVLSVVNGSAVLESIESKMAVQSIVFEPPVFVEDISPIIKEQQALEQESVSGDALPSMDMSSAQEPLPPAPYDGLTEESQYGLLPVIGKNNLTPFKAYRKPYVVDVNKPVIAIGIKGIGLSQSLYDGIFERLVPQVSVILSPYVDNVDDVQKTARAKGYETWMLLPLETKKFPYDDPGSMGILAKAGLKFNQDNFKRVLARTSGYAGIATYTDSAFLDSQTMLNGVLSDAMIRGLGVFEMNTSRDAMSLKLAINNRAPHVAASIKAQERTIEQFLTALKKEAQQERRAVGVLNVTPAMLASFQAEIKKAREEGFEIVPLSALADEF